MSLFRARNPAAPAGGAPRQARLPARSVWKSLGIDLQADAPVCGFVVKLKRMAAGRFYEFFVDDARLCVNVKAALIERHAVVLDDGLTWPRGKRCRTLPQR